VRLQELLHAATCGSHVVLESRHDSEPVKMNSKYIVRRRSTSPCSHLPEWNSLTVVVTRSARIGLGSMLEKPGHV
jgi:hypothetical protein